MTTIRTFIKTQFETRDFTVTRIRFTEDEEIFVYTTQGKFSMTAGSDDDVFAFSSENETVTFDIPEEGFEG